MGNAIPQEQNQIFVSLQLQTNNVGYFNSVKFAKLETQLRSKKRRRKIENMISNLYWSTKLNKAKQEPMTSHRLSPAEQSLMILTQFGLLLRHFFLNFGN